MPPKTGVPTPRLASSEGPVAITSGKSPNMKASDAIMTGHLFEVISMLESEGGRLAAARIGAAALAAMSAGPSTRRQARR